MRSLLAALLVAALASTASGARFYAQPSYGLIEVENYKSALGDGLAIGATFAEKHFVEIEGGRFESKSRYFDDDLRLMPLLLNYGYGFPISKRLSGSIGVSAGMIRQELDYTVYYYGYFGFPGTFSTVHVTDNPFAGGFNAGLAYRLNDHFALTFSGKALSCGKSNIQPRTALMILQLGLNCRL